MEIVFYLFVVFLFFSHLVTFLELTFDLRRKSGLLLSVRPAQPGNIRRLQTNQNTELSLKCMSTKQTALTGRRAGGPPAGQRTV